MDKMTKREINQMMMKVVNQVVNSIRPLILKQDKKINQLGSEILNTDRKLEGIKYKIIYKTKKGFLCPVCGKDMESEIYEEALQNQDLILKKFEEGKIKIKKKIKTERKTHLVAAYNDDRTACGIRNKNIKYSRLLKPITCGRCLRTVGKSFSRAF